jgi:hypothetical protein
MGDLIDAIMSLTDVYDKYGIKGCAIFLVVVVGIISLIILIAMQLQ